MAPIIIVITSQHYSICRYNKLKWIVLKYNFNIYLANIVLIDEWFLTMPELIFPILSRG